MSEEINEISIEPEVDSASISSSSSSSMSTHGHLALPTSSLSSANMRMHYLWNAAHHIWATTKQPHLAAHYIHEMVKLSAQNKVALDTWMSSRICVRCLHLLIPGVAARFELQSLKQSKKKKKKDSTNVKRLREISNTEEADKVGTSSTSQDNETPLKKPKLSSASPADNNKTPSSVHTPTTTKTPANKFSSFTTPSTLSLPSTQKKPLSSSSKGTSSQTSLKHESIPLNVLMVHCLACGHKQEAIKGATIKRKKKVKTKIAPSPSQTTSSHKKSSSKQKKPKNRKTASERLEAKKAREEAEKQKTKAASLLSPSVLFSQMTKSPLSSSTSSDQTGNKSSSKWTITLPRDHKQTLSAPTSSVSSSSSSFDKDEPHDITRITSSRSSVSSSSPFSTSSSMTTTPDATHRTNVIQSLREEKKREKLRAELKQQSVALGIETGTRAWQALRHDLTNKEQQDKKTMEAMKSPAQAHMNNTTTPTRTLMNSSASTSTSANNPTLTTPSASASNTFRFSRTTTPATSSLKPPTTPHAFTPLTQRALATTSTPTTPGGGLYKLLQSFK